MTILDFLLFTAIGYVSGSILWSRYIPLLFAGTDIVKISRDHNPGTSNVMKHCGVFLGMICLVLDLAKGFVPVFFALKAVDEWNNLFQRAFCTLPAFTHDHAVIGIANVFMPPPVQFLIQFIEHDVST